METARELLNANEPEPRVLLVDTVRPMNIFSYYWSELLLNFPEFKEASTRERIGKLRVVWRRLIRHQRSVNRNDLMGLAERSEVSTNILIRRYRAKRYNGSLAVMRTRQGRLMAFGRRDLGWTSVTKGSLMLIDVPGTHIGLLETPHVLTVVKEITDWLSNEQ